MFGLEDGHEPPPRFRDAADRLHEQVAERLGDDRFGPPDYRAGLGALLLSMDYDPRFHARGRRIAWGTVFNGLFGRAHAYREMAAHPGWEAARIERPLIITGIPRTGTTALHKLIAVDPRFQGLQGWLIGAPKPRAPREAWDADPMFALAVRQLEARHASKPGSRAAHDMAAGQVDECLGVLAQGFASNLWSSAWSAPSYDLWLQTRDERAAYAHYARVLRLIGSPEPGKRWLLKNPGHVANLDILFETFPDALVVHTHRDPAKAVPSLCAMLIRNHLVMEDGRAEERALLLGQRETEKWAAAIRSVDAVRAARPGRILDVVHADFHRDPMAVIERIYAFAGLDLGDDVRAAMARRIAGDPERSHGVHHYDIADFGLSADAVRERFGGYVGRFGL